MRAERSRSVAHVLRAARTRHYMSPRTAGRKITPHKLTQKFSRSQSDSAQQGGLSEAPAFCAVPTGLGFVMHTYPAPRRWATIFRPAKRDSGHKCSEEPLCQSPTNHPGVGIAD